MPNNIGLATIDEVYQNITTLAKQGVKITVDIAQVQVDLLANSVVKKNKDKN